MTKILEPHLMMKNCKEKNSFEKVKYQGHQKKSVKFHFFFKMTPSQR